MKYIFFFLIFFPFFSAGMGLPITLKGSEFGEIFVYRKIFVPGEVGNFFLYYARQGAHDYQIYNVSIGNSATIEITPHDGQNIRKYLLEGFNNMRAQSIALNGVIKAHDKKEVDKMHYYYRFDVMLNAIVQRKDSLLSLLPNDLKRMVINDYLKPRTTYVCISELLEKEQLNNKK